MDVFQLEAMHMHSESELRSIVAGCIANDRKSQETFYRMFFKAMFTHCKRFSQNDQEILEILNNGFLKVFRYLHTYRFEGSLEGWVRRVIHHVALDFLKVKSNHAAIYLPLDHVDMFGIAPEQQVELPEEYIKISKLLPKVSRQVFELFVFQNYHHAEIANTLGISEGTSRWHLNQAKTRLKVLLQTTQ